MSHENIALAIGISKPTLEKYFEQELSVGASRRRMELLESLHKAGRDGSVSAAKAYLALEPRVAAPPEEPQPDPAGVPVGKKAKAKAEAVTAAEGSEWQNLLKPAATVQ